MVPSASTSARLRIAVHAPGDIGTHFKAIHPQLVLNEARTHSHMRSRHVALLNVCDVNSQRDKFFRNQLGAVTLLRATLNAHDAKAMPVAGPPGKSFERRTEWRCLRHLRVVRVPIRIQAVISRPATKFLA